MLNDETRAALLYDQTQRRLANQMSILDARRERSERFSAREPSPLGLSQASLKLGELQI
jgi:hypothetical protein